MRATDRPGGLAWASAVVGALLSFAILYSTRETLLVGVVYDDAVYVDLAHSLSRSLSYQVQHLPGAPPGVKYPPLYPAWLALWQALHIGSATARELQEWRLLGNIVLAALAVGVWTLWGASRLALPATVAALMVVASTVVVPGRMVIDVLFSEPLGWVLLGAAVMAWDSSSSAGSTRLRLFGAAMLTGLLPMSRTIFLPVTMAAMLHTVVDKRWTIRERVLAVMLQALPLLLWTWWSHRSSQLIPEAWWGNYGGYVSLWLDGWDGPGDLANIITFNAGTAVHFAFTLWWYGAGVAVCCLAIGLVKLRRAQPWLLLGLLGYGVLVLLFPFPTRRYIAGILPLLSLVTASGAVALWRPTATSHALRAAVALTALLPIAGCVKTSGASYRDESWRQAWRETERSYAPLIAWGQGLPTNTRVVTESDGLFGIATGLTTAPALPWHPRDYLDRAPSLAGRLSASLCQTGEGWLALVDGRGETASVLRGLMRRSDSVHFGEASTVGEHGLVVSFMCVTPDTGKTRGHRRAG